MKGKCDAARADAKQLPGKRGKIMKKMWLVLVMGVLIAGMTACTKEESGVGNDTNSIVQEENNQSGETENDMEANNGSDDQAGNDVEVGNGSDNEAGNDAGTDDGAGNNEMIDTTSGWSEEMTQIRAAVVAALGEDYWPNMEIPAEILETNYGITSDMYDDFMAECPMISTNVDTLLIIKAKDDKVEAVEEALNAYRDKMVNDSFQYPMNVGKVQASRIQRYGNYVCFVQLGASTTDVAENGDEAVIAHCQEQNELALEVIAQNVPGE